MVAIGKAMDNIFECFQGALLLEEGFLVILKLIEEVRREDVLEEAEDVVSDEHVVRV